MAFGVIVTLVNRERRPFAEEAGFAGEDWVLVESRRHVGEFVRPISTVVCVCGMENFRPIRWQPEACNPVSGRARSPTARRGAAGVKADHWPLVAFTGYRTRMPQGRNLGGIVSATGAGRCVLRMRNRLAENRSGQRALGKKSAPIGRQPGTRMSG